MFISIVSRGEVPFAEWCGPELDDPPGGDTVGPGESREDQKDS